MSAVKRLTRAARLILIGAPGVGKGTQTERLMKKFPQLAAISSGELLRKNVNARTPLGVMAESRIKAGKLVPDKMVLRLILNEMSRRGWVQSGPRIPYSLAASSGADSTYSLPNSFMDAITLPQEFTYSECPTASFILDGFPRNAHQAKQIEQLIPINFVVHIQTRPEIIIDRICNRWIHAPSGRIYNTTFNPPNSPGLDDVTGEKLSRRADDDPDVWKERLAQFERASQPLLDHYHTKGLLWTVSGDSSNEISPKLFTEFESRFLEPNG